MYQGIQYDLNAVTVEAAKAGQFPNLCTIQDIPGTYDTIGAPTMTFTNVTGLVNIPCKSAPPSKSSLAGSAEMRMEDRTSEKQERHVVLNGYYPAIVKRMRAVIDGQPWNIMGVESDSFETVTRLYVQEYTV